MTINTKHGHCSAGVISPTYRSWKAMITRCLYESAPNYSNYGGKGVGVCARWRDSFSAFLEDMGERPAGTSIDRLDGSKDYEPTNCRWATRAEQNRNTGRNVNISALGLTMCLEDWAAHIGIHPETLRDRLARGWDVSRALTTPLIASMSRRSR